MAQIIGLPKLSPTMEEGVLVKWVKKEGDAVQPGDLVAEVETDKANMDFNLEDEGVLLKLLVKEGDTVKLGAPVAILGQSGEDISALLAQAQGGGAAQAAPAQAAPSQPAAASAGKAAVNPLRRIEPAQASAQAAQPAAQAGQAAQGGRVLASPLAKTLAIELGVDLRAVNGSGPGGRIVERDVRAAAEQGGPSQAAAPAAQAGQGAATTALAVRPAGAPPAPIPPDVEYEDRPLSNMRKRIAQRLTQAKSSIPHFYLTRSFDVEPLLDFRKRLNALLGDRGKVSVNDMIIKGVALALRRVPDVNAAFMGEAIRYFSRVNVGVAVAIEDGLVTPVVRDADLKGIGGIGNEVRDLAERARTRRLKAHEIEGSTFTVSNLGMFGVEHFEAIINPPEAAILAIGTVIDEPVVKSGAVVPGKR
ncbi:MAG TPA: 2-oxo acid dehydrogenase subunit E2, partial [Haliangium sp.]|nr:2-oxo acid dehydrogenase subunit E2 [Haliangium sp.]